MPVKFVHQVQVPLKMLTRLVKHVRPAPLQILEPLPGQQLVLLASLGCIRCLPTLRRVRPVPPFPTPPLSNAPLHPIKKLQPVMPGIMELLVMLLVKHVLPVPLQILEPVPGQQLVLLAPLARIHYLPT